MIINHHQPIIHHLSSMIHNEPSPSPTTTKHQPLVEASKHVSVEKSPVTVSYMFQLQSSITTDHGSSQSITQFQPLLTIIDLFKWPLVINHYWLRPLLLTTVLHPVLHDFQPLLELASKAVLQVRLRRWPRCLRLHAAWARREGDGWLWRVGMSAMAVVFLGLNQPA